MGKTYQKPDTEWMKGNLPLERIAGATYQLQCDYMGKNHEQISTELILAAMNEAFRRGSQSIQDDQKTHQVAHPPTAGCVGETERSKEHLAAREGALGIAIADAADAPAPSALSSASKVSEAENAEAIRHAGGFVSGEYEHLERERARMLAARSQTGVEPSKWDSSVWRHPGLSEFFKRYKPGDLVPAAEVRGVADWYEDQIEEAADRFNSKAPTVSPAVRFDAWFKTYFGERPTEAVTKSFSIGNLLQAFHAGAESPAPADTSIKQMWDADQVVYREQERRLKGLRKAAWLVMNDWNILTEPNLKPAMGELGNALQDADAPMPSLSRPEQKPTCNHKWSMPNTVNMPAVCTRCGEHDE